jgi:hypothetical protein
MKEKRAFYTDYGNKVPHSGGRSGSVEGRLYTVIADEFKNYHDHAPLSQPQTLTAILSIPCMSGEHKFSFPIALLSHSFWIAAQQNRYFAQNAT